MSQREYVPSLIIGASMLGLGLALGRDGNAVVLEGGNAVGSEFIRSFKLSEAAYSPVTAIGKKVQEDCVSRNVVDAEGRLHLAGFMPFMIKQLTDAKLDVRMQTAVVDVKQQDGKFEVTYYDASGLRTLIADELIDTTPLCVTKPGVGHLKYKNLNMMLQGLSRQEAAAGLEGFSIRLGRFEAETVLQFPIEPGDGWVEARNKLFQFWLNRPAALQSCAFVTHADDFEMGYNSEQVSIQPGWEWRPSAYYNHPLEALEHGYRLGKGGY
ncbi:hypothetical protein [Paenibacillus wynnii]|uniref:Uncharacterized protein n=1 Tax=Paenibacillus wynnii TaxID=268407 RepID=A0A098M8B7_9BACL|nr:hypothetical protein [Paenibacillus wynnii]KGE18790.1 hypothetical protein PWYN_04960 [Paenibacillus wynnii]